MFYQLLKNINNFRIRILGPRLILLMTPENINLTKQRKPSINEKIVFALTEYFFKSSLYMFTNRLPSFLCLEYLYGLIMELVLGDRQATENKSRFHTHNDIQYDCS